MIMALETGSFDGASGRWHRFCMRYDPLTITRRGLLCAGAGALAFPAALRAAFPAHDYANATVIDAQGGLDFPLDDKAKTRLAKSGLTAISMTVGKVGNGEDRYVSMLEEAAFWRGVIDDNPTLLTLVHGPGDIAAAKAARRTGVIFNVQDTAWMATDLDRLETAKALGIRVVQLTYNVQNLAGSGAVEPGDGGLTILGRHMIAEIEKNRLALDLSHGGRRTMAEAAGAATCPPIISHTGCRALADHPRNTDDATMRMVAMKGGFVGIFLMPYLAPGRLVTADDVIRHIEHAYNICGEDHIGIGTDGVIATQIADKAYREQMKKIAEQRIKEGIAAPGDSPDSVLFVPELNGPSKFWVLADRLSARGWPAARIDKLLGANAAKVFDSIWS